MTFHMSTTKLDALVTFFCSFLSLFGSIMVTFSYYNARSVSKPRAAILILNLAIADFCWFLAAVVQASFWVLAGPPGEPGKVPIGICYIASPAVALFRLASLFWTCIIAYDVHQSVKSRKMVFEADNSIYIYAAIAYGIALPSALVTLIKQSTEDQKDLGCSAQYENVGNVYEVLFMELIPIIIGFCANIYVFTSVCGKLSSRTFPHSVRKRRRKVMYHYTIVCIVCWAPTIVFYLSELSNNHYDGLEVFSRGCLYITGFLNFLMFGMQDPHLKRSFRNMLRAVGLSCLIPRNAQVAISTRGKTVMFEAAEKLNADIPKDKRTIYRYHRLSKEDKMMLYTARPDLDLRNRMTEPLLPKEKSPKKYPKEKVTVSPQNDDNYSDLDESDAEQGRSSIPSEVESPSVLSATSSSSHDSATLMQIVEAQELSIFEAIAHHDDSSSDDEGSENILQIVETEQS